MFEILNRINQRPEPFEFYTAETLWNDEHISKKMLELHLNEDVDPASRKKAFMDKSVAWIASRFNIGPDTKICDFGCGPGLYTTQFAEKGAAVTGADFSERSIRYARETAKQNNLDIDYVLQNYLEFTTDKKYNLITMIYCDLCPLSPEQRKTLLGKFYEYLEDDGSVVLDVFSLHAFEQRKEVTAYEYLQLDGFWSAEDYYGFMNTYRYEKEKVVLDKYTIIEESRTWEVYNWLQYYSLESLREEFEESGLRITEHYSDVAGAPYSSDSTEIAVVARKIV
jgi:cyclopropane fatty-acyl-phospholipid synthase-like methyltransferase